MEVVQFPLEIQTPKRSLFSRVRVGANADVEVDMDPEQEKVRLMKTAENRRKYAFRAELLVLVLITSVFGSLAYLIWRLASYCDRIRISIEPDVLRADVPGVHAVWLRGHALR